MRSLLHDENERLRAWKAEAIEDLKRWDEVWIALGCPEALGEYMSTSALREVRRLLAENQRLHEALSRGCDT